jgi:DNA invertase Pin-like site-specific DNA recombinase
MTYKAQKPKDPNGLFRTLVLGRVSTPKQSESNIQASYDYVRPIIKQIYDGPVEVKEFGEQGSGMLTERATILEAYAELETGRWDLVLMEDLSKAYRNPRWQVAFPTHPAIRMSLLQRAQQNGLRGLVVAQSGYGNVTEFRTTLDEQGLSYSNRNQR